MIPITNLFTSELEVLEQPSKDFKLDKDVINGTVEGLEAVKQMIYKVLNTERYQYLIYSWDYGIELMDLYGEPVSYVVPELKRRITEALLQDDRIENVSNFNYDLSHKGKVRATFTVSTKFGNMDAEKEVAI